MAGANDDQPGIEIFLELEEKVWAAMVEGDPAADAAMLAEDFVGLYPSGFSNRHEHAAALRDGPMVTDYKISEARLITVSDSANLLCYRADWRRVGKSEREAMYVSSLWSRRSDRWLNVFSQDCPVEESPTRPSGSSG